MIPVDILEPLIAALAHWDGRGPTHDDAEHAGKEMAAAVFALLRWDSEAGAVEG